MTKYHGQWWRPWGKREGKTNRGWALRESKEVGEQSSKQTNYNKGQKTWWESWHTCVEVKIKGLIEVGAIPRKQQKGEERELDEARQRMPSKGWSIRHKGKRWKEQRKNKNISAIKKIMGTPLRKRLWRKQRVTWIHCYGDKNMTKAHLL